MSQETNRKLIKLAKRQIRNCKKNGARVSWKVVHQGPPETRFNLHKRRHKDSDECKDMVRAVIRAGLLEAGFFSQREDEGMVFFVPSGGASAKEVRARVRSRRWVGPALVAGGVLFAGGVIAAGGILADRKSSFLKAPMLQNSEYEIRYCTCQLLVPNYIDIGRFCGQCSSGFGQEQPPYQPTYVYIKQGPKYPGEIILLFGNVKEANLWTLWIYMLRYRDSSQGYINDPLHDDLRVTEISAEQKEAAREKCQALKLNFEAEVPEIVVSILSCRNLGNFDDFKENLELISSIVNKQDKAHVQVLLNYAKSADGADLLKRSETKQKN